MASIDETKEKIRELQDYDTIPVLRELSELSFVAAKREINLLVELYRSISLEILEKLPQSKLDNIFKVAEATKNVFTKAREFKVDDNNPATRRDELVKEIKNNYDSVFTSLSSIFSFYSALVASDIEKKLQDKINEYNAIGDKNSGKLKKEVEDLLEEIKGKASKADEALKGIRQAAAEQGITKQAEYFSKEGNTHTIYAKVWLLCSIVILGILVSCIIVSPLLGTFFPSYDVSQSDVYKSVNIIASKMLFFAVITYLLFLSVKNFNAHRHNAVVNIHRQNALLTYSAIVSATNDERHKDAVLNHAASCIFAPQESGYTKSDANKGSLVEIIPKLSVTP